jgi:hypothetical protein
VAAHPRASKTAIGSSGLEPRRARAASREDSASGLSSPFFGHECSDRSQGCRTAIETAQSGLDCSVLKGLPGKTVILRVIDLNDHAVETPGTVAERIRRALP